MATNDGPQTPDDDLAREAHRQSLLIASHPGDDTEQARVDEVSIWTESASASSTE